MNDGLREVVDVMTAYRDAQITPDEFIERFSALHYAMMREQDAAIAAHPVVAPKLAELREQLRYDEVTTDGYLEKVRALYDMLPPMKLRPGSREAVILDHVFVEADAYRDEIDEDDDQFITADELREVVRQALDDLGVR